MRVRRRVKGLVYHIWTVICHILLDAVSFFCSQRRPSSASTTQQSHWSSNLPVPVNSGGYLPRKLYNLFEEFNVLNKPSFFAFLNEKLTRVPDQGRSIKQWALNNMRVFEYDRGDIIKRWAVKVASRERHLVCCVRKQFEETGR